MLLLVQLSLILHIIDLHSVLLHHLLIIISRHVLLRIDLDQAVLHIILLEWSLKGV